MLATASDSEKLLKQILEINYNGYIRWELSSDCFKLRMAQHLEEFPSQMEEQKKNNADAILPRYIIFQLKYPYIYTITRGENE